MENAIQILEELRKREQGNHRSRKIKDAYIVSFPRSGRTWIRRMLQYVMVASGEKRYSDLVVFKHDGTKAKKLKEIRRYNPSKKSYVNSRVGMFVRDPRDVVTSSYFLLHDRIRSPDAVNLSIEEFTKSALGLPFIVRFMNDWAKNSTVPSEFRIFCYEDFLEKPIRNLANMCVWLGFEVTHEICEEAVAICNFEDMQAQDRDHISKRLRIKLTSSNALSVRQGTKGGYVDWMPDECVDWCNEFIEANLDEMFSRYRRGKAV